jgi:hypothetical protein
MRSFAVLVVQLVATAKAMGMTNYENEVKNWTHWKEAVQNNDRISTGMISTTLPG